VTARNHRTMWLLLGALDFLNVAVFAGKHPWRAM
jgi:hypothetical protein